MQASGYTAAALGQARAPVQVVGAGLAGVGGGDGGGAPSLLAPPRPSALVPLPDSLSPRLCGRLLSPPLLSFQLRPSLLRPPPPRSAPLYPSLPPLPILGLHFPHHHRRFSWAAYEGLCPNQR